MSLFDSRKSNMRYFFIVLIISHALVMLVGFQLGLARGISICFQHGKEECRSVAKQSCSQSLPQQHNHDTQNTSFITREVSRQHLQERRADCPEKEALGTEDTAVGVMDFVTHIEYVPRDQFIQEFDIGVPWQSSKSPGNDHVVLLSRSIQDRTGRLSWNETLQSCEKLNVVLTIGANISHTCLAIVGQHESHHVFKFAKHTDRRKVSYKKKWKMVSSYQQSYNDDKTMFWSSPPKPVAMEWANQVLMSYLQELETIKASIHPVLQRIVAASKQRGAKTLPGIVVVMVCNYSHATLLLNFYCAAQAAGVTDFSPFLVFAIDRETATIARGLGLTTFYHEGMFSFVSTNVTATYGSIDYARVMIAKVFSVHLVNALGYDVLFHDVDIIPLRGDYLEKFVSIANKHDEFDLHFQHDLNTSPQYGPWSANSGFYLARSNSRTRYLFHRLCHSLDLILRSKSHQATLTTILSDLAVMFGLRTKVLSEYSREFPVGYHFHNDWVFMKSVLMGDSKPYSFHINWNQDQDEKRKYCEQMGMWYIDRTRAECSSSLAELEELQGRGNIRDCCVAKPPLNVCHYRDKPSKVPCLESPMIESGVSFW